MAGNQGGGAGSLQRPPSRPSTLAEAQRWLPPAGPSSSCFVSCPQLGSLQPGS